MHRLFQHVRAFYLGIVEFRLSFTTGFLTENDDEDHELYESYDRGRELAHVLTFRRYDDTI